MTNKQLVTRFLEGRTIDGDETYGLSVKPFQSWSRRQFGTGLRAKLQTPDAMLALYSREGIFPLTTQAFRKCFNVDRWKSHKTFLITPFAGGPGRSNWNSHIHLVTKTAKKLNVKLIQSPRADKDKFQNYMEYKINGSLIALARDLITNSTLSAPHSYQQFMADIHTLLDGETELGLPKNQVPMFDDEVVQDAWRWLIKENPIRKDRKFLLKIYTLSKLLKSK